MRSGRSEMGEITGCQLNYVRPVTDLSHITLLCEAHASDPSSHQLHLPSSVQADTALPMVYVKQEAVKAEPLGAVQAPGPVKKERKKKARQAAPPTTPAQVSEPAPAPQTALVKKSQNPGGGQQRVKEPRVKQEPAAASRVKQEPAAAQRTAAPKPQGPRVYSIEELGAAARNAPVPNVWAWQQSWHSKDLFQVRGVSYRQVCHSLTLQVGCMEAWRACGHGLQHAPCTMHHPSCYARQ